MAGAARAIVIASAPISGLTREMEEGEGGRIDILTLNLRETIRTAMGTAQSVGMKFVSTAH